jgi:hypothetical protein
LIERACGVACCKLTKASFHAYTVDGAGWLPSSITNLGYTYQPLGIIGLRKILTGSPQP